jgi:hypothetical protein
MKANRLATKEDIRRDVVFVGVALLRRPYSHVKLLPQILPCPH